MKIALWLFIFSFALPAVAEYRVYKLKISDAKTGKSREILSNLLPTEYRLYNSIGAFESIVLLDHWMCWKRSDGFKDFCPRPTASPIEGQKTGSPAPGVPALAR